MDALIANEVPSAAFRLTYQRRDITEDVTRDLLALTYTDNLTDRSDDLQVDLMDAEGKWRGAWYPGHGDTLALSIGWAGKPARALGSFEIDEVEASGPPSSVSIKAVAAGINRPMRTTEHRSYEGATLAGIAGQVAARLGLQLTGRIAPIRLDRLTQQESDLEFLTRLAGDYDYAVKIASGRLAFHSIADLAARPSVATINLTDLASFRFRDQIHLVPKAVQVKHKNPATKKLVAYHMINGSVVAVPSSAGKATTSGDTKKQRKRAASAEVAAARATADQARQNRERTTASWTLLGRPNLVSGNVVTLANAGMLGGTFLIMSARHRLDRSGGYVVELEVCRVKAPALKFDGAAQGAALDSYGINGEVMA
ncbi:phage late control D family protein [Pseudomonas aeruginosa]|uniref:phage late control D family protein n=1 Tax=Pseudomonas aeruginosa TaxID=287 RepID=UPI000937C433|nr:contractile injection system protein, VgrG/Pvc8 family [Pseudomonas aeruginosa]RCM51507.1 tail protein [Pseudomonas aeruginosa]HCT4763226.1 late control protein D [Pseudomonas aeruginosa]HDZ6692594.1 late control protein D [Pseudomonas aeruginosa]